MAVQFLTLAGNGGGMRRAGLNNEKLSIYDKRY